MDVLGFIDIPFAVFSVVPKPSFRNLTQFGCIIIQIGLLEVPTGTLRVAQGGDFKVGDVRRSRTVPKVTGFLLAPLKGQEAAVA